MSFSDIFKKGFLNSYTNTEITFQYAVIAMLVCVLISVVICAVYYFKSRKYFFSKEFAVSLVALAIITTAVILTIQSSIVVSLGMVGALSIVRFRTAIKNPLDLVFLFWAIAVGIICGAGIYYIAVALTLIVGIVVLLSDEVPGLPRNKILVLDGTYPYREEELTKILKKHTKYFNVRSESVHNDSVNLIIEVRGRATVESGALIGEIRAMGEFHDVSLLVQEGAVD
jgi:uncharacterized membrane protein YhiD involved in acid resistance